MPRLWRLHRPTLWRVLLQRPMRSTLVIILQERLQMPTQGRFVEDDQPSRPGELHPEPLTEPDVSWQVRPENSILRSQVLVLKEEFLVDRPCYIRQQTNPMIAVFHAQFHHRSFLIFKPFEYFDHSA